MAQDTQILLAAAAGTLRDALFEQLSAYDMFSVLVQDISDTVPQAADAVLMRCGSARVEAMSFVRRLREASGSCPILVISPAHDDPALWIEAGASDVLAEPLRFTVLISRLKAMLRQQDVRDDVVILLGPYRFLPGMKLLILPCEEKVRLTEKETAILSYLHRTGTQPVTREELLHNVWGYHSDVTTHTLETHVYRLRQKMEIDPTQASLLVTEAGGYRLALETA